MPSATARAAPRKRQRSPLTQPQFEALEREIALAGCGVAHAFVRDGVDEVGVLARGEVVGTVRREKGNGLRVRLSDGREFKAADAEAAVRRITRGWA